MLISFNFADFFLDLHIVYLRNLTTGGNQFFSFKHHCITIFVIVRIQKWRCIKSTGIFLERTTFADDVLQLYTMFVQCLILILEKAFITVTGFDVFNQYTAIRLANLYFIHQILKQLTTMTLTTMSSHNKEDSFVIGSYKLPLHTH
jgi:hypothetical protein